MSNESERSYKHLATRRARTVGRTRPTLALSVAVGLFALSGCDSSNGAADRTASGVSQQSAATDGAKVATTRTADISVESSVAT